MKVISETSLSNFQPWSGATDTRQKILQENKDEEFEAYIEETHPDGITDTELNDFLWFEEEYIYEFLGIKNEEEESEENTEEVE